MFYTAFVIIVANACIAYTIWKYMYLLKSCMYWIVNRISKIKLDALKTPLPLP